MPRKKFTPPPKQTSDDPYTLNRISDDMKMIIREICTAQEEKDSERVEELTCELVDLIGTHRDKYQSTAHVILNSVSAGEWNQAIANQYQAKATAHKNLAKFLKENLHRDMKLHGITRLDAGQFTIREQKNGIASLEVEVEPEELPKDFQEVVVNTAELRAALEFGEKVDGAYLKIGTHIRIVAKG